MDTNRIRYFLSLAKLGSITKAAELHQISPAAFSKAMRVLSDEVGRKLLLPSGRGVVLTDDGCALVPVFSDIVTKLDSLRSAADIRSTRGKELRLATFEVFSTYLFERVHKTGFAEYDCVLHESTPGKMEAAVAAGVVDLALTYLPIPTPGLDFIRIAPIEMGIFGNCRPQATSCSLDELGRLPFVVPVTPIEGTPTKVRGLDGWPDDAIPRTIRYRVQLMETALGLCRAGSACAYLPRFVVRLHNEIVRPAFALREIKVPEGIGKRKDYVYLVKRKSDFEGVEAKRLAAAVRQFCASKADAGT